MTITADDLEPPDRAGIIRWTVCLLIVLALHGGLLLVAMLRQVPIEPIGMPPAAVMIDLAPLPAISAPSAQTPPPEPEQQPLPLPEPELPKFEPSPAPHPPVALPAPQPPKPKPQRIERPPVPQREPVSVPPTSAPGATVPTPPGPTASSSQTVSSAPSTRATWQAQLVAWLEKYKRYPRLAQEQRQQGVAYLRFTIDREGKVISSRINKSSGFELLDDEVLALIQRAQPVPSPPPEVAGDRIELLVPVAFSLRR